MVSSWQARLVANNNKIAQKVTDNSIKNSGLTSDAIIIREGLNLVNDVTNYDLFDIDNINIIFPVMEEISLWRFFGGGQDFDLGLNDIQANDAATENKEKGFECFAEVKFKIDMGSIILRVFDNPQGENPHVPQGTDPWVLPLQVKSILGSFGGRSMVYQKIVLGYLDAPLSPALQTYLLKMATRRITLGW